MPLLANINVGSAPNDGTGDSIRESFIIVNENFQYIEQFFPNTLAANLNANITSNGTSYFNTVNISGILTSTGNISTSAYFFGNGSQLTGVIASTANTANTANTATTATTAGTAQYVTENAQANITSLGTLTSLTVTGNIAAGNLSATLISGTITTASQTNITSVGTLSTLAVAGNATINGNVITSDLSFTGNSGRPKITANGAIIDKVGLIIYDASLFISSNITQANINFSNTFPLTYAYRTANSNVTFNYSNVTAGREFSLHLKNTNGSTIYATVPNNNNNKATNLIPITTSTVAKFTFLCYDGTDANVAATIINN